MAIFRQRRGCLYENERMNALPDMHDGFFEGLFVSESKTAHLFFRSHDGTTSTLVLRGIERLVVSDFKAGNIVFDLVLTGSGEVTVEQIEHLYGLSNAEKAGQVLTRTQESGLRLLEVNPSYGAECTVLFRSLEVLSGRVWPGSALLV